MVGQSSHAHGYQGPFGHGHRAHHGQELVGPIVVDRRNHGLAFVGQLEYSLAPVRDLLRAPQVAPPHEPIDEPAGGRRRTAQVLGQVPYGQRLGPAHGVERGQLGEADVELAQTLGDADDELSPERETDRDAVREYARVLEFVARGLYDWG